MTIDQKIDEVLKVVLEQGEKSEGRDQELLLLIQEQGERHDRRFAQMDDRFTQLETRLTAKIDKVYEALSQDISVFAEDLYEVRDRVDVLEKKLPS